jgi:glyoxylase-like metal-dependent hydrolase (beta-lactamase superfamily II)
MGPAVVQVGELTVISLSDGAISPLPVDLFPSLLPADWADEAGFLDAGGRFNMNFGCFLIREGERWTLVDTGYGWLADGFGGELLPRLQAVVAPEQIDRVILTHLHADHIGGTTLEVDRGSRPAFANARYIFQRRDWEAAPRLATGFPQLWRCVEPIVAAGLLDLVDGDASLTPGISLLLTPGHTPGHQCVLLASQGEKAVITGDLTHTPMQLNHPEWRPGPDLDADLAVQSRAALFDRIEQEGLTLCAGHYPYPSMGTVLRVENRRVWRSR